MGKANDTLLSEAINHAIDLAHYSNSVVRRMMALLSRTEPELIAALASALSRMEPGSFSITRIEALLSDVKAITAVAVARFEAGLRDELKSFASAEVGYQGNLVKSVVPPALAPRVSMIDPEQVYSGALSRPFQGRLLREWTKGIEDNTISRIRDAVRIGFLQSKTTSEIVTRIRGTAKAKYSDGLLAIERRAAEAVVRTSVAHTAAFTRERFYDKNSDLIDEKQWVSTLDSRTTPECQVRDGLHYTMDDKPIGHSIPWDSGPGRLHWNCRSTSIPVLKMWKALGLDGTPGERASMDGTVKSDTTYKDWLSGQSAARQDEILGPTRGALMRKGELSVDKFWNDKGVFLTLDQLRARNESSFTRAGV